MTQAAMPAGEIRQNKVTKQWVIFAPDRRRRPRDFRQSSSERKGLPEHDPDCPFCPGNEASLPEILVEMPAQRDGQDWQTRVVPNKYPALVPGEKDLHRYHQGIYLAMPRYGKHEVVIETPQHNRDLALMGQRELETVVETYHRRYVDLMREHDNMIAIIFRNHGRRAGTSLLHPHSQIIVAGMAPRYIRFREEAAQAYYDELGRCVYCDILKYEMDDQERVIFENELFLAFVPFAADVPFEVWIMPKIHRADFGSLSDAEKDMLTAILGESLSRLHDKLSDPDYNYVINTAAQYKADEPQLHWCLQIQPRLTTRAGFEIGSGVRINPSIPEEDAAYLKQGSEDED